MTPFIALKLNPLITQTVSHQRTSVQIINNLLSQIKYLSMKTATVSEIESFCLLVSDELKLSDNSHLITSFIRFCVTRQPVDITANWLLGFNGSELLKSFCPAKQQSLHWKHFTTSPKELQIFNFKQRSNHTIFVDQNSSQNLT